MILEREIKELARSFGVPESTIERDYAQNWLLKYLNSLDMVLKGGTGIRKTYISDYRFSDDLDFTLLENSSKVNLTGSLKRLLSQAKEESDINFYETIDKQEIESGLRYTVKFNMIRRVSNVPIKIDLDITTPENEKILLPFEDRKVIHPYSDKLNCSIKTYSIEEIIAEKVRALFQRVRPRDLYDVWYLIDKLGQTINYKILEEKCKNKKIQINAKLLYENKPKFLHAWETSLRHQMKEIPEFSIVFQSVITIVSGF